MTEVLIKEHPILFSGAMVRALLDGSKTQTRRTISSKYIVSENPDNYRYLGMGGEDFADVHGALFECLEYEITPWVSPIACPYGQPGERLWVRESFYAYGYYEQRFSEKKQATEWHFVDETKAKGADYIHDWPHFERISRTAGPGWYKRPSIHMPRTASRLLLEVVSVRVERLQAISETDGCAEGVEVRPNLLTGAPTYTNYKTSQPFGFSSAILSYETLWASINGPGSWATNPWVWVVEFKVVKNG